MNYDYERKILIDKRKVLLDKYQQLLDESKDLASRFEQLFMKIYEEGTCDEFNYSVIFSNLEEAKKFKRLVAALNYVENPNDSKIVNSLVNTFKESSNTLIKDEKVLRI